MARKIAIVIVVALLIVILERYAFPQDKKPDRLTPENQLLLQRFVSGELVKILQPLPCGRKSVVRLKVGESAAQGGIKVVGGCQTDVGVTMRITGMEFGKDKIKIDINGGTLRKKSWREKFGEHVQVGVGVDDRTVSPPIAPPEKKEEPPPNVANFDNSSVTISVEFKEFVPDMRSDDLKQILSTILVFPQNERSAAVQWIETLPPDVQEAIGGKYAINGMAKEMVRAAIGSPDNKRRESGPEFTSYKDRWTEEWWYGTPPGPILIIIFDKEGEHGNVVCIQRLRPGESVRCRESSKLDSGFISTPDISSAPGAPAEAEPAAPSVESPAEPPPSLQPRLQ